MNQPAILGGSPITESLLEPGTLKRKKDLERKYLLEAFETDAWDCWMADNSQALLFEQEFAEFSSSENCLLVTNGTHALQLALEALDIGFGDEVIVPGLTWQATASVVCDVNAVPIFVDIDPETLCIDTKKIEQAITSNTRAIIPVHLYHRLADLDELIRISQKYGLKMIEDCSHTHGSRWKNKGAGTFGDIGTYSFQSTKLMNCAEGGAVLTQDSDLYWKMSSQRSCGRETRNGYKVHSGNYRITSFQGGVLRGQLAAFRDWADVIDRNGLALDMAVNAAPGVHALRRNENITRQCGYGYVFKYDIDEWDGLPGPIFRKALSAELGVGFGTTYEPLNDSPYYYPHTKKRHQLFEKYYKSITPSRWELPEAEKIYQDTAVVTNWRMYGCSPEKAGMLSDAIQKLYENRAALHKFSKE